mmetsp:Transcript_49262/g.141401  ORF Transcript_49262/g.141401 Transcript_49262/m.141401 type:complete len:91 (-) Transcript_49262:508-780(-)
MDTAIKTTTTSATWSTMIQNHHPRTSHATKKTCDCSSKANLPILDEQRQVNNLRGEIKDAGRVCQQLPNPHYSNDADCYASTDHIRKPVL